MVLSVSSSDQRWISSTHFSCSSSGVDQEFEKLMNTIFGTEIMEEFKMKRPAGYVDLMIAFEARKRTASPFKNNPLNISLPFSFIDFYKKKKVVCVLLRTVRNYSRLWSLHVPRKLFPFICLRYACP